VSRYQTIEVEYDYAHCSRLGSGRNRTVRDT